MTIEVVDLLPRDSELARRAAGGDGAAFVRLYDGYAGEVFAVSLAATGSVEAAANATQTGFLRLLRWPPPLGAPDDEVAELLCALALGGGMRRACPVATDIQEHADAATVGWLRSETVANAGARFDDDWSVHLWHPAAPEPAPEPVPEPLPELSVEQPRRRRLRILPRWAPSFPAPAATAAIVLAVFVGAAGTMLAGGGTESMKAAPTAREPAQTDASQRAEVRQDRRPRRLHWGPTRLLREKTLKPLLAP